MDFDFQSIYEEFNNKNIDLNLVNELYLKNEFQSLFEIGIHNDLENLVKYLYQNGLVKFYVKYLTNEMDEDLYSILNSDIKVGAIKVTLKKSLNSSLEYLNYMKRYSKLNKDEKGFYYFFNKL